MDSYTNRSRSPEDPIQPLIKMPSLRVIRSNNYFHFPMDTPYVKRETTDRYKNYYPSVRLQNLQSVEENKDQVIESRVYCQPSYRGGHLESNQLHQTSNDLSHADRLKKRNMMTFSHGNLLEEIFQTSKNEKDSNPIQCLQQQNQVTTIEKSCELSLKLRDHTPQQKRILKQLPKMKLNLPQLEKIRQEIFQSRVQMQIQPLTDRVLQTDIFQNELIQQKKKEFLMQEKLKSNSSRQKFQPSAQRKFKNESTILFDQLGGEQVLKVLIDRQYVYIESDPIFDSNAIFNQFKEWFGKHRNLDYLKNSFVNFLSYATGHNTFYIPESLRAKHSTMGLKGFHFDQFKFYLLRSFLELTHKEELLHKFSCAVEQFRFLLLNKNKIICCIYNDLEGQENEDDSIKNVALSMYQQIQKDPLLGKFFEGINIINQADKFCRIIKYLMNWDVSSKGPDLSKLRELHRKYNLQEAHYVFFRQQCINSMRKVGFKDKTVIPIILFISQIYLISRRMDGFKSYILNKNSLEYLSTKQTTGKQSFIDNFSKAIQRDIRIKNLCAKLGKYQLFQVKLFREFLTRHCNLIYTYFCHEQSLSINLKDLCLLHNLDPTTLILHRTEPGLRFQKKYKINEEEIDAFIEHFLSSCATVGIDKESLEDIKETWIPIKNSMLGKLPLGKRIGKENMKELERRIMTKLDDKEGYKKYFKNCQFDMRTVMTRVIYFLLHDQKYYRPNDLKLIHERVKITESAYDYFSFLFEFEAKRLNFKEELILELNELFMKYKPIIVQKKDNPMASFDFNLQQLNRKRASQISGI